MTNDCSTNPTTSPTSSNHLTQKRHQLHPLRPQHRLQVLKSPTTSPTASPTLRPTTSPTTLPATSHYNVSDILTNDRHYPITDTSYHSCPNTASNDCSDPIYNNLANTNTHDCPNAVSNDYFDLISNNSASTNFNTITRLPQHRLQQHHPPLPQCRLQRLFRPHLQKLSHNASPTTQAPRAPNFFLQQICHTFLQTHHALLKSYHTLVPTCHTYSKLLHRSHLTNTGASQLFFASHRRLTPQNFFAPPPTTTPTPTTQIHFIFKHTI